MKIYTKLTIYSLGVEKEVLFGAPETQDEIDGMYKLRQNIYRAKGYFHEKNVENTHDIDDYDSSDKVQHIIAKIDGEVIGSIRLIFDSPLPTQRYFEFKEPVAMRDIDYVRRAEIGRLVVSRKVKEKGLPRNIILLFFLKVLIDFAQENCISGGYMFLKKAIRIKLRRLRVPIHLIRKYKQVYPANGVLYNYFNDSKDKVIPAYFIVSEVKKFIESVVGSRWLFKHLSDKHFILRNTFYNRFLARLGIF